REPRRGAAWVRARPRRRGRRAHGQAGAALPRRHPRGARALRRAARRLQRLRRVRDREGRRRARLPRRACGCARVADGDQARGRRHRDLVLDEGARALALRTKSSLWLRATKLIPGGVNSPVRAMRAVGLDEPVFVRRGEGAYLEDVEGRRYVDWVMSWGPLVFGHADPETVEAVVAAAERGTSFGAPTEAAVELAAEIVDAAAAAVERYGEGLAAILVEPVAGNMGVVPAEPGFLEALRRLCDASGALLVFDEVITGFRVARGGAQERYGILPDLTILGKIVGGGLPLAAFGGRADIMGRLATAGDVYRAGTLSGNPLATAAGLAVLRRLRAPA